MNMQQVWSMTHKSLMPTNCTCIKNKWVFKIKYNSVYRASIMACRYSQAPNDDFSKTTLQQLTTFPYVFYYE